ALVAGPDGATSQGAGTDRPGREQTDAAACIPLLSEKTWLDRAAHAASAGSGAPDRRTFGARIGRSRQDAVDRRRRDPRLETRHGGAGSNKARARGTRRQGDRAHDLGPVGPER